MRPRLRVPQAALMRLLLSLESLTRVWLWTLGAGIVLGLFGLVPSLIGIAALTSPIWVTIIATVYWGRMLDETMNLKTDIEDGPR